MTIQAPWKPDTTTAVLYVRLTESRTADRYSLAALAELHRCGIAPIVVLDQPAGQSISLPGQVKAVYAPDTQHRESFLSAERALIEQVLGALIPEETTLVVLPAGGLSVDLAASLAIAHQGAVITGVQQLSFSQHHLVADKFVVGGQWHTQAQTLTNFAAVTFAKNVLTSSSEAFTEYPVSAVAVADQPRVNVTQRSSSVVSDGRPALEEAAVVITGGRGTQGDFSPINELADTLGAAVGATRDAVDEGWAEHHIQVGQTGKTVAPTVYISAGVSGAIHQRVGMDASEHIIAINNDEDAPVFDLATVGIVGDLFEVLPALNERIKTEQARQ